MRLRFWRMHRKLDVRLAEAGQRARDAATELELSRARARATQETVVRPLRKRAEDNQFAEMLRKSLNVGYGNENGK